MDKVSLVISALSLVVAGAGTFQANRRAKEAIVEARTAAADTCWVAVQEAVQRLIGFDPTAEPIGERLANLRIAMISLVDHLDGWDGLDAWLETERTLGAAYSRQVMETAEPDDGVEERVANLEPLMTWAQGLSHNLRHLRSVGHNHRSLLALHSNAQGTIKEVYTRNGWNLPTAKKTRLRPLD